MITKIFRATVLLIPFLALLAQAEEPAGLVGELEQRWKATIVRDTNDPLRPVVEITTHCDSDLPDEVLARLASLPKLRHLGLVGGQSLTDEGIGHIAEMKGLVELELRNKEVTAAGIKRVALLPSLRKLSLWDVRMTEEVYRELEACRSLEVLELRNVSGSEAALKSLARCPKLKRIDAFRC